MTPQASTPLGSSGKSIHADRAQEAADKLAKRLDSKRERHNLREVARRLLWKPETAAQDQHRTCWCHRTSHAAQGGAQVYRVTDGTGARLGGVTTCGAVWTCPVCCAKVAETRRTELSRAMAQHIKAGGHAYLVTFTFPHDHRDALQPAMDALALARQRFQNSRTWKNWCEQAERVGAVTSLEVTYGQNGWHPHMHMLVFAKARAFDELEGDTPDLASTTISTLAAVWVHQLQRVGLCDRSQLTDAMRYGFNVRGGEKAAEYVAKYGRDATWGASSELSRAHAKVGRVRAGQAWHVTPFQMLSLIDDGDDDLIRPWHEYSEAFTGKRMLTWTPGLKKHFDILELDDEDLAAEGLAAKPEEEHVAHLSHQQLARVSAAMKLGDLLHFVATKCGEQAQRQVDAWIELQCGRAITSDALRRRMEGSSRFTVMPPHQPCDMAEFAVQ